MKKEEEIRQNAVKYSEQHCSGYIDGDLVNAHIAGAHSRDEEIKELQKHIDTRDCRISTIIRLEAELEQLRDPWISVKDRLPEDGDVVITRIVHVVKGGGEHSESVQHLEQMYRGRWLTDSMEQHRRNGILYDCISEVTHWMPIPELPKGE